MSICWVYGELKERMLETQLLGRTRLSSVPQRFPVQRKDKEAANWFTLEWRKREKTRLTWTELKSISISSVSLSGLCFHGNEGDTIARHLDGQQRNPSNSLITSPEEWYREKFLRAKIQVLPYESEDVISFESWYRHRQTFLMNSSLDSTGVLIMYWRSSQSSLSSWKLFFCQPVYLLFFGFLLLLSVDLTRAFFSEVIWQTNQESGC